MRGGTLLPGSGVELISHFGGMTDCLGGRGSHKVSRRASGSGTKWLSDSMKKQYHEDMLYTKIPTILYITGIANVYFYPI